MATLSYALYPTLPVVDRPDSVTHWTCPHVPGGHLDRDGKVLSNTTHHINGVGRCAYCHHTVAELVAAQKVALDMRAEDTRRAMVETMPAELQGRVAAGEDYWTTPQMRELFEVEGFAAPYVLVRRKADQKQGTLLFTHMPRFYFGWEESR